MSNEQNGNEDDEGLSVEDGAQERDALELSEQRLEDLADEIAATIGECPPEEREALHDYAVSLVRERLPVLADDERYSGAYGTHGSAAGTAEGTRVSAGYGFLLIPVGFVILPVLPPVGVTIMIMGFVLVVVGVVAALFARVGGVEQK
ncbi:MAG: hypothetical protein ACI8TX_002281 [Hyphomicrobiaceae bacterium]|jgi:hypothetical protein